MKKISLKIKKFFAYILVCFSFKAAAEAVNAAASEDELDVLVLQKAGFQK